MDVYQPTVNRIIIDYNQKQNKIQDQENKYITAIASNLFEIPKESILLDFPNFLQNDPVAKQFLTKFHQLTNQKCQFTTS